MAMIGQQDLVTLFVTLSAAETRWPHLLKLLAKINCNRQIPDEQCHHLSWGKKCRLISINPVTCVRLFLHSFNLSFQHNAAKNFCEYLQFADLVSISIPW
jgi:hypothetical protein